MKVAVIGDMNMVMGFALTGVKKARIAETPEEAEEALKQFIDDAEVGIIILLDLLAEEIRSFVTNIQERKTVYPIIIEMPGKDGPIRREDPMDKLIRKAVGIDIKSGGI
ncbi:MAG: hypothetical protein LRZ87_02165 [Methanocellales archaeon]|nr:hypothetical protein [Methanocellales archaeon]